jgi:hypothetical protein
VSDGTARVGHIAVGVARSWSNVVTASAGIVSVIGGPLPTGFRRAIDEVIRTTAPMHDGFGGGAFVDTAGKLIGVPTAAEIRGLAVVIPVRIAWATAAALIQHGTVKRGYMGLAGQPVRLPDAQRGPDDRDRALLVVAVTPKSPAEAAGVLVGDLLLDFDGRPSSVGRGTAGTTHRRADRSSRADTGPTRRGAGGADDHGQRTPGPLVASLHLSSLRSQVQASGARDLRRET